MVKFVGVNEVAKKLGISAATASRMARLGQLPARKYAGAYRFDLEEVEAWLAEKSTGKREVEPDSMDSPEVDLEAAASGSIHQKLLTAILAEQRETRRVLTKLLNHRVCV